MDIVSLKMESRGPITKKIVLVLKGAKGQRHPKTCKRYTCDKGCQFGSDCAYKHTIKSIKSQDNKMAKKVELLETVVIVMGNNILKLEAEIKNIKSSKSKSIPSDENESIVKKDEETKDKTQLHNKPDQSVQDPTVTENKKEILNETVGETPKLVQSCFKCQVCGASFKKEVTLKTLYHKA